MSTRRLDMRTWAEIDLDVVQRNAARIRERRPHHDLIGVLKADAYGHGAAALAEAVVGAGATMLGVGDSREALELILAGVKVPVIILGAIIDGEMPAVIRHDIRTTIHSMNRVEQLEREADRQERQHSVHIKVDTGMGRLGMMPERAVDVARRIAQSSSLLLEGLSTHLANSNLDVTEKSQRQLRVFQEVHDAVVAELGPIPVVHAMNTAAAWNLDVVDEVGNALRVGAALYGIPGPTLQPYPFEPAMTLKSQIIFMKDVPAGTSVGYNGTWVAERRSRLATLPLGFNDGLPPSSSVDGFVLVRGQRAPVRGAVSMDYTTVDVTDIEGAAVGDEALVFGRGQKNLDADGPAQESELPLRDVAERVGSSPYAMTCGVGKRVHRLYFGQRSENEIKKMTLEESQGHP
ncbi:MAG: alanine racemase [Planctomycetota bacterium]